MTNTEKRVFKIDLTDLAPAHRPLSKVFASLDTHFLAQFSERKDMIRCYKDIPMPLQQLYSDPDYVHKRHG